MEDRQAHQLGTGKSNGEAMSSRWGLRVSLFPPAPFHSTPARGHPPSPGTQGPAWMGCARNRHPHPARGAGNLLDPQLPPLKTSFSPSPRSCLTPGLQRRREGTGRGCREPRQRGRWQGCVSRGKASHVSDELRERLGNEHQRTDRREETGM